MVAALPAAALEELLEELLAVALEELLEAG